MRLQKMIKMKGQSTLISHAILVSISIMLVFLVIYSFSSIKSEYESFVAGTELDSACLAIKTAAEKIYTPTGYISPQGSDLSEITIDLPSKAAGMKYRTKFENRTLYLQTLSNNLQNVSCKIGLDAQYFGSTTGGETKIIFSQSSQGVNIIRLEQVE
jgi:hypothetical protein